MKKILLSLFAFFIIMKGYSQVGINILIPDSSAALQVESNSRGVGLPRLTSVQMNAINAPLNGLTIFNTNDSVVEYWNGSCWLKAYEPNCYYCDFQMTVTPLNDTLDRAVVDSVYAMVVITRTHGTQPITATWSAIPPSGVQIYSQGNTTITNSPDSFKIIVAANIFSGSGNVPILVTAYCGTVAHFATFNVYIKPCVQVNIVNDYTNYDVQALNSTLLPAGSLVCLLVTVNSGVTLHSGTPTLPALTIGNLNPMSIVGIMNGGAILGRGGDGGGFYSTTVGGNPGQNGGNALDLTTQTIIQNPGEIYAGGGGGGSIGLVYSVNVPIVGTLNIGVGSGGGGGSESGQGGTVSNGGISIGAFSPGTSATPTVFSTPGSGAVITTSISISVVTLTPYVVGGNGGGFAQGGGTGVCTLNIQICINIPFLGTICPVNTTINVANGGAGGSPGLAIKRNANPLTGIADGSYYGFQIKGTVAP